MKISILLLFIGIGITSAAPTYSQNAMLTLKAKNKPLKDVIHDIENQSEYIFFYNDEAINVNKRVDIAVNDATIDEVLDKVLDKATSKYKINDRQVVIYKNEVARVATNSVLEQQQSQHTVTGVVRAANGETLIGVSVVEKGTTNGVATDVDGKYTIALPNPNATLVFSYISYETMSKRVEGKTSLNIILEEKAADLDEIIVVAYGTQKKSSVTGAISVVNAEKLKTVTTPNVNAMLQGKVAGVQVLNTSGKPGEAAQIRIRGKSTLNSSVDPLWVIDGVVAGSGSQLNPNEIESISVLKDAAATALYGSRASNGVILVTTKSGKLGENKVDVSVKVGITKQNLGKFNLMNSQELYDYTAGMQNIENQGLGSWFNKDLLNTNTDWFNLATQEAFSQNYTVSYTTGGEKIRSFVSGDFYNEEGTVKGYDYNRFSIRSNTDYKVTEKLTIKTKISGSYWNDKSTEHSIYSAMLYLPWDKPYNDDGSIRTGLESDWRGRDRSNYLYNQQWDWDKGKQLGVSGTIGFDYKIMEGLTFESNNNIGYRYKMTKSYTDPRSTGASEYNGSIGNKNNYTTTKYSNQLLRYNNTFHGKHTVGAFLGYEYSDYQTEDVETVGRGIPINGEVPGVAANPYKLAGTKGESAMQSYYFNTNYTYDDRYMGQFSYRIDGSSRFGKNNRYGGFFTFGGAWSINNESFMEDVSFVDQLKLRASYGSVGNTPASGNYGYMSVYALDTQYNGIPAAFPKRLGNPDLKWEKGYEFNVAVDARLFNRVNISIDYYNKKTSDLLYLVPLPSISGYQNQYQNIGRVNGQGVEITLSPEIIKTKDWKWNMDFNLGLNKSKIEELKDHRPQITGSKIREEGEKLDTWYMPEWAGVDVHTGMPMWYIVNADNSKTLTSDISKATRQKMGSANPNLTGGIMTDVSYKGFTLAAAFSFVSGNKIYHSARELYDNDGAYITYNSMKLKDSWSRWEKPGDIASHPQAIAGGNNSSNKESSRYLEDGSYFRMNNLVLSYNVPAKAIRKFGLKYATISLSGENLFTITNFSGTDAEIAAGEQNNTAGASLYPSVRRFSLGVNLSF